MATKRRLEIQQNSQVHTFAAGAAPGPVKVVTERTGTVTVLDKAKAYYHSLISVLGAILVLLNEVTPLTDFLPANLRHWVSVIVVFLTALANFLKSNEQWVDNL